MRACRGLEEAALALEHVEQAQAVRAGGAVMVMRAPREMPRNRWVVVKELRRAAEE